METDMNTGRMSGLGFSTILIAAFALVFTLVTCPTARADVPVSLNFQGYIETGGGVPWSDVSDIVVRLYPGEDAGDAVWEEWHDAVPVENGLVTLTIGATADDQAALAEVLWGHDELWLGFEVAGLGEPFERHRLVAAPYSVVARRAEQADSLLGPASDLSCDGCVVLAALDGAVVVQLDQSADLILLDAQFAEHAADPDAHHIRYTDAEAEAAMEGAAAFVAVQGDVGQLQGDVGLLEDDVVQLEEDVALLGDDVGQLGEDIAAVETDLTTLSFVNLLPNGSFEMALTLWAAAAGTPALSEGDVHGGSGQLAMLFDATGDEGSQMIQSAALVPLRSETLLTLAVWTKGYFVTPGDGLEDAFLARVDYLDSERQEIPDGASIMHLGEGTYDWTETSQVMTPPAGAAFAQVSLGLSGTVTGMVLADDVRLHGSAFDLAVAPYAAAAYPGGPALALQCDGCLDGSELTTESVTAAALAEGSVQSSHIQDGTIQDADIATGGLVPPGTVIWWWRPNTSHPIPSGFVVCDGQVIPDGPMSGHATPNLMNRFPMGVANPEQQIYGGENTRNLSHNHHVSGQTTSSVGNHNHTVSHNHKYAHFNRYNNSLCYTYNSNGTSTQPWFWKQEWYAKGGEDGWWALDPGGNVYDVADFYTQNSNPTSSSNGGHSHTVTAVNTNSKLSASQDFRPAYVGLLPLMRM